MCNDPKCFAQPFHACRLCHDEVMDEQQPDPKKSHTINRFEITQVKCLKCEFVQIASDSCQTCGFQFGHYFCHKCHVIDLDTSKKQFHCDKCGICRVGGRENFKHCDTCKCCVSTEIDHICTVNALENDCPICLSSLFNSRDESIRLPTCGHTMHKTCFSDLSKHKY